MGALRALATALLFPLRGLVSALLWVVSLPATGRWWLGFLRVELWRVDGEEQHSRLPLSVLCAVSNRSQNKNYLLKLIFGDSYRQQRLGRCWLWNLAQAFPAAASDCSMIVGECCESHLRLTGGSGWFLLPAWLYGTVELPRDVMANRKVDRDLRRIRQRAFQFEVTRDPQRFDDFYHNMYLPYIAHSFGQCADLESYRRMKGLFRQSDLLFIKDREKTVAAQMILYEAVVPSLWAMGTQGGDRDCLKEGAGAACYHFALQHLQDQGYKKVGLGWSRPFLRDGVLRFKRNWSQRITYSYFSGFAMRVLSFTPAVRAFLGNNPFVFKRGERFYGAVFVDGDKPFSADDIRQIEKDYFHAGLSRLHVYWLPGEREPAPGLVPAELAERVELRRAGDSPEESAGRAHPTSP